MVSGARVAITRTPGDCQCADTTSTAVTSGDKARPIRCSCGPSVPGSTANIGEPWDTNIAGAVFMSTPCGARGRAALGGNQAPDLVAARGAPANKETATAVASRHQGCCQPTLVMQ